MRDPSKAAENALHHVAVLHRHLERASMDDEAVFDAVSMRLSAAIDSMSRVDEGVLLMTFGDSWYEIKATRNAIVHGYHSVNARTITEIVREDLPGFEAALNRLAAGRA